MGLGEIKTVIKATMESVADVGVVTDWEPLATRKEEFLKYFKAPGLPYMQGWTITRESSLERTRNVARTNDRTHLFIIRGYRAIDNEGASEKDFQDLVESLCDVLRARENDQLDGTAELPGPPSVRICEPRNFAGYLVHYAEIAYLATEPKTF